MDSGRKWFKLRIVLQVALLIGAEKSPIILGFSIAHALQKQGQTVKSVYLEASARDHLKSEKARRYHFADFDSYWQDTIMPGCSQCTNSTGEFTSITPPANDSESSKIADQQAVNVVIS